MKRRHAQRGSSMVEFAIASSALFLVLFGIVEFGRAMYVYHAVANAARIGSRWAMVRGSQSCSGATGRALATCPATSAEISDYVKSVVPLTDSEPLTVTATWPGGNQGCTAAAGVPAPGCVVVVTASNRFNFAIPFVSTSNWQISSTSQMTISQ